MVDNIIIIKSSKILFDSDLNENVFAINLTLKIFVRFLTIIYISIYII
jgi:hypothetical protein